MINARNVDPTAAIYGHIETHSENEETNTALSLGQILAVGGLCTLYGGGIYLAGWYVA